MKRYIPFLSLVTLCAILAIIYEFSDLLVQPRFVHRDGKYLVAPDGRPLQIRGINLGNWLVPEGYMFGFTDGPQSPREIETFVNELIGPTQAAEFWQQYRDNYIMEDDIRFLHQAGFNTIRVPLHYKFFTTENAEGFRLLDRLVAWASKYNIYVILDLHCAPGGQTGSNIDDSWDYPWLFASTDEQENVIGLWQRIARHYRNNPTVLGYDLLNEPIPAYLHLERYAPALTPLYKRITAGIRQVDTHHVIILDAPQWDAQFDANAIDTFHYYWAPATEKKDTTVSSLPRTV